MESEKGESGRGKGEGVRVREERGEEGKEGRGNRESLFVFKQHNRTLAILFLYFQKN